MDYDREKSDTVQESERKGQLLDGVADKTHRDDFSMTQGAKRGTPRAGSEALRENGTSNFDDSKLVGSGKDAQVSLDFLLGGNGVQQADDGFLQ